MVFFTSDLHNYEDEFPAYEFRKFKSYSKQEDFLVNNWNKTVTNDDTVFVLGDIGNPNIFDKVNYKKLIIVKGNHDINNKLEKYASEHHDVLYNEFPIIVGENIILSHEPLRFNDNTFFNIHGHLHGHNIMNDLSYIHGNRHYNVSVDSNDFSPVSWNRIKKIIGYFDMFNSDRLTKIFDS